jgi:DNA-binding transcriptional LysR family regulator
MAYSMIRLRQLQALEFVLSSRTMTVAAELFGVTQPAMSRLISQLEEEVGCQLLRRERGRFRLTAEGARFYDEAEKVLIATRRLNGVAESLRKDTKGSVRIVSMHGLINNLIHRTLASFSTEHPNVRISIDTLNRARLEEVIQEMQFDIAFATLPVRAPASLTIDSLAALPAICIVPARHPLARKKIIEAHQLEGVPFISERQETLLRSRVDAVFDKLNIHRSMQFECHNTETICDMVAAGMGVSIVHPFIKTSRDHAYVERPFQPNILLEYAMITAPKGRISRHAELLARRVLAEAKDLGRAPRR